VLGERAVADGLLVRLLLDDAAAARLLHTIGSARAPGAD
jgi:hypothetical protein